MKQLYKQLAKRQLSICTLSTIMLVASILPSYATVGGGQRIEVLGYAPQDKKIYVLRHFDDGRGRLPQLYYYDLKSKKPQKLVEVRSIYVNPQTNKHDEFDDGNQFFNPRINKIINRLTKLAPKFAATSIEVHNISQKKVDSWLGSWNGGKTYQYDFTYKVVTDDAKSTSTLQTAEAYNVSLMDNNQVYQIPNQPYAVTKVSYQGEQMEGGYDYEDVVLLKK